MAVDPTKDMCTCGEARSAHSSAVVPNGHGACLAWDCNCTQFTWSHFAV